MTAAVPGCGAESVTGQDRSSGGSGDRHGRGLGTHGMNGLDARLPAEGGGRVVTPPVPTMRGIEVPPVCERDDQ